MPFVVQIYAAKMAVNSRASRTRGSNFAALTNFRLLQQLQPKHGFVGFLESDPQFCHKFSS